MYGDPQQAERDALVLSRVLTSYLHTAAGDPIARNKTTRNMLVMTTASHSHSGGLGGRPFGCTRTKGVALVCSFAATSPVAGRTRLVGGRLGMRADVHANTQRVIVLHVFMKK